MVYTLTVNPAVDYNMHFTVIKNGEVCRSEKESINIGGKGINVSMVLAELDVDSVAIGFLAGFTGDFIENELKKKGINTDFIHLDSGITRINVKIKSDCETDLNASGPEITEEKVKELKNLVNTVTENDILVISGSAPKTMPVDIYSQILKGINPNIRIVIDISGKQLLDVLQFKPFLIKPNNFELSEIFGVKLTTADETEKYARKLQKMGAVNVLVSLGKNGAMLIDEFGNRHDVQAIEGKPINTVGAGDSMVAGFLAGYLKNDDYGYALRLGNAAGNATAFSDSLATKQEIKNCFKLLEG